MLFFVTKDPAKRVQRDSGATKPRSLELNRELILLLRLRISSTNLPRRQRGTDRPTSE